MYNILLEVQSIGYGTCNLLLPSDCQIHSGHELRCTLQIQLFLTEFSEANGEIWIHFSTRITGEIVGSTIIKFRSRESC